MVMDQRQLALQVAASHKDPETPEDTVKRAEAYLEFLTGRG